MNQQPFELDILWGEQETYLYGTMFEIHPDASITFDNPLLPPGEIIHTWYSLGNYQANRQVTPLPLLMRNHVYSIQASMQETPEPGVFLKVIFYDRYEDEIGTEVSKTQTLQFTYPADAYSYKIQLISAGMQQLEFQLLTLREESPNVES